MTQMPLLVHRLRQLTESLSTLRERVREAVATEFGKAVGQTVQDLIQMLARPTPERTPHDRRAVNKRNDPPLSRKPIDGTSDVPDQSRWSVAARTAAQVFCAWQARRSRLGLGLVLGLLAGAAAWAGTPFLTTVVALAGTTLDLFASGTSPASINL